MTGSTVDRLLKDAGRQFAGNKWVGAMLGAMKSIADSRSRERIMKVSTYSSGKLRSRLVVKDEDVQFCATIEASEKPAYLRRKPAQGKADV